MDQRSHLRGPCNIDQISLLLHIGSVNGHSRIFSVKEEKWDVVDSCDALPAALASFMTAESGSVADERLPISEVPALESVPCQDPSCPKAPSCDVVYIWDRKSKIWLTYDEYVLICREVGLNDGLPERVLVESQEQMDELLLRADMARIGATTEPKSAKRSKKELTADKEDEPLSDPEKEAKRLKRRAFRERKKLKREAGIWTRAKTNPNVYISGLPEDVTVQELVALFKRAGQLKLDMESGEPKVRLYGNGDGLVSFVHVESVQIATDQLNEYELRPGTFICVQQADFSQSGPQVSGPTQMSLEALREKAQLNRDHRQKLVNFYRRERQLRTAWDSTEISAVRNRLHSVVVFQNCFDPRAGEVDYEFIESQVEKFSSAFGEIKLIKSIRNSLDGFICVKFSVSCSATACVAACTGEDGEPIVMINRRLLTAFPHDGRDLASRLYHAPEENPATDIEAAEIREMEWEELLYEENESDDEDLVIRTE